MNSILMYPPKERLDPSDLEKYKQHSYPIEVNQETWESILDRQKIVHEALAASEKELNETVLDNAFLLRGMRKDGLDLIHDPFIPQYIGFKQVKDDDGTYYEKDSWILKQRKQEEMSKTPWNLLNIITSNVIEINDITSMYEGIVVLNSLGVPDVNVETYRNAD